MAVIGVGKRHIIMYLVWKLNIEYEWQNHYTNGIIRITPVLSCYAIYAISCDIATVMHDVVSDLTRLDPGKTITVLPTFSSALFPATYRPMTPMPSIVVKCSDVSWDSLYSTLLQTM